LTRNGILALEGATDRIDGFARGGFSKVDDLESRCRPQRVDRLQNQLLRLNGVKPAS
jgi:hypothetical protein